MTTRTTTHRDGKASVTRVECVVCGEHQQFLDLVRFDRVDHRCPTPAMGSVWWLSKAAVAT